MKESTTDIHFYKQFYDHEHERRIEIDKSVSFPTSLLTFIIGGTLYLFETKGSVMIAKGSFFLNLSIIILTVSFVTTMILTIGFLMRMFINTFKKYQYLPSPLNLREREIELFKHYLQYYRATKIKKPKVKAKKQAKKQFNNDLLNYYTKYASLNQKLNDSRIKDFYASKNFLILSIIFITITGTLLIIK